MSKPERRAVHAFESTTQPDTTRCENREVLNPSTEQYETQPV
jgi:hypothetical protein